jgi:hypothetical protein
VEEESQTSTFWRGRYWRERATSVFLGIGLAGVGLAFLVREVQYNLLAGAAVLLPTWWVVESWLGLHAREIYEAKSTFWFRQLTFALLAVVTFAFGVFYRRADWDADSLVIVAPMFAALIVRTIYLWRDLHGRSFGVFRAPASRFSGGAIFAHLAGYAVALAAGFAAASYAGDWLSRLAAYAGAVMFGKLAIDLLVASPPPLDDRSLTSALTRMTVASPLLWGVPWALLVAGYFMGVEERGVWSLEQFAEDYTLTLANVVIAVVLIFAVATAAVFVFEPRADKTWAKAAPADDDALRPADWARLYWVVLFLTAAGLAVTFVPRERSDDEVFGVDKWTCAKKDGRWTLARLSNGNFDIRIRGRYIDLFNVSCVPRKDGSGCQYDDEGWDEVEFVVHGRDGFDTAVKFNRTS